MSYTHFTLIRHGLPQNSELLLGRTDPPLSPDGLEQMVTAVQGLVWDRIISSPRKRCCEFARALAGGSETPLHIDERWQELDFGDWDGQPLADLWLGDDFAEYWQEPFVRTPPGGESTQDLLSRVRAAAEELGHSAPGQRLLIFTHSGVIRAVLAWLLDSQQQGNPHLSRVHLSHGARLEFTLYRDDQDQLWPQLLSISNNHCRDTAMAAPSPKEGVEV